MIHHTAGDLNIGLSFGDTILLCSLNVARKAARIVPGVNGIPSRLTVAEGHLDARISAHAQEDADLSKAIYLAVGHLHMVKNSRSIGIADHDTDYIIIRIIFTNTCTIKSKISNRQGTGCLPNKTCSVVAIT